MARKARGQKKGLRQVSRRKESRRGDYSYKQTYAEKKKNEDKRRELAQQKKTRGGYRRGACGRK